MIIYYENSNGEKINLLKAPYRTVDTDVFDSDWNESDSGYEKKVAIDVFGNRNEFKQNMEHLYNVFAVDSENGVYGKLYVNETYLRCNVRKSRKSSWKGYVYSEVELVFFAPVLEWIQEISLEFYATGSEDNEEYLEYPYDYPYEYSKGNDGKKIVFIDHVVKSDFRMTIEGPCVNPMVTINGYPYEVLATIEAGEHLVIDSSENTVIKYLLSREPRSLFNERGFEHSIFEPIPPGMLTVTWSGFRFELIVFKKRREASW